MAVLETLISCKIAAQARQVSAKLAEYTGMAKQFNARELMYGQEQTDYERLSRITKIFEPYAQLWIGVDNWRRWQVQWKTGDFSQLDPEQMDKDIGDTWRNLFKASKALADFEGTMLFVSHDRHFLSALSNRVLELTPEGVHQYGGGYSEYVARTGQEAPGLHPGG